MKRIAVHNGGTPDESVIYETGDEAFPYKVRTPRGDWRVSDLLPALHVAHVAGRGIPRQAREASA